MRWSGEASELGRGGGQTTLLGDVEDEAFGTEFLPEYAVLFLQVGDHVLLLVIDETRQRHKYRKKEVFAGVALASRSLTRSVDHETRRDASSSILPATSFTMLVAR
jgi:hypothetical protein